MLKKCLSTSLRTVSLAEVDAYICLGGDVNRVYRKMTLLGEASRKGSSEVVSRLLEEGAKVELCDSNECSPLYLAASHGHIEVVKRLIAAGSSIDKRNNGGFTPLISALKNNRNTCAKLLLKAGASVNIACPATSGGTQISLLAYILFAKGDWDMANTLLIAGIQPTKYMAPLGFILLNEPTVPFELIRKFVYAGFDVIVDGWLDLMERKGDQVTDLQRKLFALLQYEQKNAPSLQRLSRTIIRAALSTPPQGQYLLDKVDELPLPKDLQHYLKLDYL